MTGEERTLTAEEAVGEVLDEVLGRHHGIISSAHHEADFLRWLRDRGFKVVPIQTAPVAWPPGAGTKGA